MTPKPQTDCSPAEIQEQLTVIQSLVEHCKEILACNIHRLTIMVESRQTGRKVFKFPPGTVPDEIKQFFTVYANRLSCLKLTIEASQVQVRHGNITTTLIDFIKEYTAGVTPSIEAADVERLQRLDQGQEITIEIDGKPHQVQRMY
jgi:hypothetical protein